MGRCGICGTEPRGQEADCARCGAPLRRDHGIEVGTPAIPVRRFGSVPLPADDLLARRGDSAPVPVVASGGAAAAAALRHAWRRALERLRPQRPGAGARPSSRRS